MTGDIRKGAARRLFMLTLLSKLSRLQKVAARSGANKASAVRFADTRDVFTRVTPQYAYPRRFEGYIRSLEGAIGAGLRLCFGAPPQHGKTVATLNALLYLCRKYANRSHVYMTYSVDRAQEMAKEFRTLCELAGITYGGTLKVVELPNGVTVRFTSADKGLNGSPVNGVFIVDDFYSDQAQANSIVQRRSREIAWRGSVIPRLHPGASVVILATRWHPEDMSGVLIGEGYTAVMLPAIAEENDPLGRAIGEALWPEERDLEFLARQRIGMLEHAFQAMYQQNPRPAGIGVFRGVTFYSALPTSFAVGYGIDLAYTDKKRNDESGFTRMYGSYANDPKEDVFYIVNLCHGNYEVPVFAEIVKASHYDDGDIIWRSSGTETGTAQLLRHAPYNIPVRTQTPPGDKLLSATAIAIAWNQGRVRLPDPAVYPEHAAWVKALIKQAQNFTGSGQEHDDLIDTIGNAHAGLTRGRLSGVDTSVTKRRPVER